MSSSSSATASANSRLEAKGSSAPSSQPAQTRAAIEQLFKDTIASVKALESPLAVEVKEISDELKIFEQDIQKKMVELKSLHQVFLTAADHHQTILETHSKAQAAAAEENQQLLQAQKTIQEMTEEGAQLATELENAANEYKLTLDSRPAPIIQPAKMDEKAILAMFVEFAQRLPLEEQGIIKQNAILEEKLQKLLEGRGTNSFKISKNTFLLHYAKAYFKMLQRVATKMVGKVKESAKQVTLRGVQEESEYSALQELFEALITINTKTGAIVLSPGFTIESNGNMVSVNIEKASEFQLVMIETLQGVIEPWRNETKALTSDLHTQRKEILNIELKQFQVPIPIPQDKLALWEFKGDTISIDPRLADDFINYEYALSFISKGIKAIQEFRQKLETAIQRAAQQQTTCLQAQEKAATADKRKQEANAAFDAAKNAFLNLHDQISVQIAGLPNQKAQWIAEKKRVLAASKPKAPTKQGASSSSSSSATATPAATVVAEATDVITSTTAAALSSSSALAASSSTSSTIAAPAVASVAANTDASLTSTATAAATSATLVASSSSPTTLAVSSGSPSADSASFDTPTRNRNNATAMPQKTPQSDTKTSLASAATTPLTGSKSDLDLRKDINQLLIGAMMLTEDKKNAEFTYFDAKIAEPTEKRVRENLMLLLRPNKPPSTKQAREFHDNLLNFNRNASLHIIYSALKLHLQSSWKQKDYAFLTSAYESAAASALKLQHHYTPILKNLLFIKLKLSATCRQQSALLHFFATLPTELELSGSKEQQKKNLGLLGCALLELERKIATVNASESADKSPLTMLRNAFVEAQRKPNEYYEQFSEALRIAISKLQPSASQSSSATVSAATATKVSKEEKDLLALIAVETVLCEALVRKDKKSSNQEHRIHRLMTIETKDDFTKTLDRFLQRIKNYEQHGDEKQKKLYLALENVLISNKNKDHKHSSTPIQHDVKAIFVQLMSGIRLAYDYSDINCAASILDLPTTHPVVRQLLPSLDTPFSLLAKASSGPSSKTTPMAKVGSGPSPSSARAPATRSTTATAMVKLPPKPSAANSGQQQSKVASEKRNDSNDAAAIITLLTLYQSYLFDEKLPAASNPGEVVKFLTTIQKKVKAKIACYGPTPEIPNTPNMAFYKFLLESLKRSDSNNLMLVYRDMQIAHRQYQQDLERIAVEAKAEAAKATAITKTAVVTPLAKHNGAPSMPPTSAVPLVIVSAVPSLQAITEADREENILRNVQYAEHSTLGEAHSMGGAGPGSPATPSHSNGASVGGSSASSRAALGNASTSSASATSPKNHASSNGNSFVATFTSSNGSAAAHAARGGSAPADAADHSPRAGGAGPKATL